MYKPLPEIKYMVYHDIPGTNHSSEQLAVGYDHHIDNDGDLEKLFSDVEGVILTANQKI